MKVLITGATGMLGSAIVEVGRDRSDSIFAPTRSELDLNSETSTFAFLERVAPDVVIHCAAKVGGISANISNSLDYLSTNIKMDASLLGAARKLRIKNLIYMASSCMYPKNLDHPMKESEILTGPLESTNEGYALAKLVSLKTVEYMSAELNWRTLVLSNLYGPRDHFESDRSHMLAAIIEKAFQAQLDNSNSIEMWGDGSVRREFTYVEDVAKFIWEVINDLEKLPVTLNVGAGIDYSVAEYYAKVIKNLNYQGAIIPDQTKPTGMKQKLMDISLAKKYGWKPTTDIDSGISKTIEWYRKSLEDIKK